MAASGLSGGETVTYHWTDDGIGISGAVSSTYTADIVIDGIADASAIAVSVTVDGSDPINSDAREVRYASGTLSIANQSAWTVDDTSASLDASASGAGLTFSYAATGLPAGVSINSGTGAIAGTPTYHDFYGTVRGASPSRGAIEPV